MGNPLRSLIVLRKGLLAYRDSHSFKAKAIANGKKRRAVMKADDDLQQVWPRLQSFVASVGLGHSHTGHRLLQLTLPGAYNTLLAVVITRST